MRFAYAIRQWIFICTNLARWGGADKKNLQNLALENPNFYFNDSLGQKILESYLQTLILPIKSLWKNQNIIVIEGFNSYFGMYNDLFSNAKSIIRLNKNPSFHAYSKIAQITQESLKIVSKFDKNEVIFCIALGATAKILCANLHKNGYKSFDLGNMSISYDCTLLRKNRALIDTLNLKKEYILFLRD